MSLLWPTTSMNITQAFRPADNPGHTGVDIGAPLGSPVIAPADGTVQIAGWDNSGYGNLVALRLNDGRRVLLAHLSDIAVKPEETVAAGELVGHSGSTGNSTGPHLHFEVRDTMNLPTDPMQFTSADPAGQTPVEAAPSPAQPDTTTRNNAAPAAAIMAGLTAATTDVVQASQSLPTVQLALPKFNFNWRAAILAGGGWMVGLLLITLGLIMMAIEGEQKKKAQQAEALKTIAPIAGAAGGAGVGAAVGAAHVAAKAQSGKASKQEKAQAVAQGITAIKSQAKHSGEGPKKPPQAAQEAPRRKSARESTTDTRIAQIDALIAARRKLQSESGKDQSEKIAKLQAQRDKLGAG